MADTLTDSLEALKEQRQRLDSVIGAIEALSDTQRRALSRLADGRPRRRRAARGSIVRIHGRKERPAPFRDACVAVLRRARRPMKGKAIVEGLAKRGLKVKDSTYNQVYLTLSNAPGVKRGPEGFSLAV